MNRLNLIGALISDMALEAADKALDAIIPSKPTYTCTIPDHVAESVATISTTDFAEIIDFVNSKSDIQITKD